jgi:5-methylcytosine-specific restriction endonuclease McrA
MSNLVPEGLRRLVIARADHLCEYCLIHEDDTVFGCQVDHVISRKHNGPTELGNLAYACCLCNRRKGADVGSIHWETGEFIRLFSPRRDRWAQHFRLRGAEILPISPVGEVTVRLLGLDDSDSVRERRLLIAIGKYPTMAALARILGTS